MSNPGDRWRRGWLVLLAALLVLGGIALGIVTSDDDNGSGAAPAATEATSTEPTEAAATEAPATEAPATEAPATEAPATEAVVAAPFVLENRGDVIVLTGSVASDADHQAILAAVQAAWPGRTIDDQLVIVAGAAPVGDLANVIQAFGEVSPTSGFTVDNGVVTLTGEVTSEDLRTIIGKAVEVTGRTVDNQLTVAEAAPVTEAAPPTEAAPATEAAPSTEAVEIATTTTTTRPLSASEAATEKAIEDAIKLDGIQFVSGSATLTAEAKATLDNVAKTLASHPEVNVEIGGHTDNSGAAASNKKLSQQRADAVKAYLTGKGVAGARMTAMGYGQDKPIADNATAAGRTKNRRIEFTIR